MAFPRFKRFEINAKGRDFAVGDIHGCFSLLEAALAQVRFDPAVDRLFSVGDLTDRGPQSHRAREFLDYSWFEAVRGNHCQLLIDSASDPNWLADWLANGGDWGLGIEPDVMPQWVEAFDRLPLALEVETPEGKIGLVHANPMAATWAEVQDRLLALPDASPLKMSDSYTLMVGMLWSRSLANSMLSAIEAGVPLAPIAGLRALVIGHTALSKPVQAGNVWAIDTGACFPGGSLTLLDLQTLTCHSFKSS